MMWNMLFKIFNVILLVIEMEINIGFVFEIEEIIFFLEFVGE